VSNTPSVADYEKIKKELEDILKLFNDITHAAGSFSDAVSGQGTGKRGSSAGGGSSLGLADFSTPAGGGGSLPPQVPPPSPPWAREASGSGGSTGGSAAVQLGTAAVGGVAGIMPDTHAMVDMQQSLFQASYATGGNLSKSDFDRLSNISKSAFGNMQTSVGSAQRSAAIVSQFGFDPYGAAGQKMLGQVGAISLTTGMSNEQVAGTIASQSTNSVMTNRMRMLGFEMFDSQGNPKDVAAVAHHILKITYGSNPTPKQIQMGLRPGGALDLMIQSYIPDPGMAEIIKDNMRKQALNNGQYTANDAATANRLGLNNNSLNTRTTGMRYQSTESNKADSMRNSAVTGYNYGVDFASSLNEAFTELATNVQIVSTLLQGAAGIQGGMSGFFSTGPGQTVAGMLGALKGIGNPIELVKTVMGLFHAKGGSIKGPGGPKDDKVPALLSNGEFVVQAEAVQKYGVDLFESLNAKKFADGGFNSPSEAVSWALAHTGQDLGYSGLCDHFVAQAYGQSHSGYESAKSHYQAALAAKDIHTDSNPPPGALVYWDTGQYGHIALSVGGGKVASTDFVHKGQEDVVPIADITAKWGTYLGWSNPFYDGKVQATLGPSTASAQTGTSTLGSSSTSTTTGSSAPDVTGTPPLFQGTNISFGVSGVSGKYQSILSAMDSGPVFATLGSNQSNSSQSVGSAGTTATPGTTSSMATGNYGSGDITGANLVKLLHDTGFAGEDLRKAYGVVIGESGGNPRAVHKNTSGQWAGSTDWGLMQMNDVTNKTAGGEKIDYSEAKIFDPVYNARIGLLTKNERGWTDWNTNRDVSPEYSRGLNEYDQHPDWHKGFSKGSWRVDKDQIANIHQNEMILPAPAAEAVRTVMRESRAGQTSSSTKSGGVVINLSVARASDDDASRIAQKVRRMIDDEQTLHSIGSGHP